MVTTLKDWVSNQLLLLYAIDRVNELTVTRIHKTAFLSQRNSYKNKKSTFNYQFTRMPQGPWSDELKRDIKELTDSNYLSDQRSSYRNDITYKVKKQGIELLNEFSAFIDRNRPHLKGLNKHVDKVKNMEYQSMLDYIYSLKNPANPKETIEKTQKNKYILTREICPLNYEELQLTLEEIATLEVYFTPGYSEELMEIEETTEKEDLSPYIFG